MAFARSLNHRFIPAAALVLLHVTGAAALGQDVVFEEHFEDMGFVPIGQYGPAGLIAKGWIFKNNGEPVGPEGWYSGCCWGGQIDPLSGTGYLAASANSSSGAYSLWAILPEVPAQQAGDIFTIYTVSSDTSPFDNAGLEIRYSPSGGTNVGVGAASVGDFTTLLLDIPTIPNYNTGLYDGWTKWELTLPGPGRIAIRQDDNDAIYLGLEDVSITTAPPPETILPEGFEDLDGVCGEGPCKLVDKGWIFKDQGTLTTGPGWQPPFAGDEFTPHSGFSFMKSLKGGDTGSINAWAILPPVPSQNAGDVLSFFVRGGLQEDGTFEVRYSPSGGTATGSGGAGIGDFTTVLTTFTVLPFDAWQPVEVTIPGNGRIALRVHDPFQPFFDFATVVAVDTMAMNTPLAGPPLPQAGETVVWSADLSPIEITTDLFIPVGGTVIVDAGVHIDIDDESTLSVGGTLIGNGTARAPIVIESVANFPAGILVPGTLDLTFANINTQVRPAQHGSLLFTSCTFAGPNALIFNESVLIIDESGAPPFIKVTDCTFDGADLRPSDAILALTDTTFINADASPLRGYVLVDQLTFDGGGLSIAKDQQPVYIDHITVMNAPGAAISVGGGNLGNDYFFGASNVLQNNGYTAGTTDGGILPGSVLPATGNNINAIAALSVGNELRGPYSWSDAGVPYHVLESAFVTGEVNLLPGATLQFANGVGYPQTFFLRARGLPGAPVTLEALSGQWYALFTPYRLEHTIVDGSEFGIVNAAIGLPGFFDSTTFSHNDRAIVGGAIIRKSSFLGNNVGADIGFTMDLDGQTNPNSFVGNTIAVLDASDATHNWWGDPSGPTSPQNPGGQGDVAASGVPVLPFLMAPPDASNHPPIIQLQENSFVTEPGSTFIVIWNTIDTDLVAQRVLLSTQNDVPGDYTVVADNLPTAQRAFAFTAPASQGVFHIRVEGIDAIGQIGWDHVGVSAAPISFDPSLTPPPVPPATSFKVGYPLPIDPDVSFFDTGFLLLDDQLRTESFGAPGVLPATVEASTNAVRYGLRDSKGAWTMGEYFTVRPDERLGDSAPSITLQSPLNGSFAGGTTVPIAWTASDDEFIRSISIHASYDGGLTWHSVARDVPGERSSFEWPLPPLMESLNDVRIRVVAFDARFQSTAATSDTIALTPGTGGPPTPDINGDGVIDGADLAILLGAWGFANPAADLNSDGIVDASDLAVLLGAWGGEG